jgi:transcriptional regulator with XRE-family HTH domain
MADNADTSQSLGRRSAPPEPLWREVLGRRLRAHRVGQQEKLTETAERAGISPQYLSEIERGRKEPSSEMIAAVAGALGVTLIDLTAQVAEDLRSSRPRARCSPSPPDLSVRRPKPRPLAGGRGSDPPDRTRGHPAR